MILLSIVLILMGIVCGVFGLLVEVEGMGGMVPLFARILFAPLFLSLGSIVFAVAIVRCRKRRKNPAYVPGKGSTLTLAIICAIVGGIVSLVILGIFGGDVDDNWWLYCIPGACLGLFLGRPGVRHQNIK